MTNKRTTKRAFMLSLLSLLMCCTMLLGTTFAWFTDTVTSTGNRIVAGTLKVDLLKYDAVADDYVSIANKTGMIFDGENGNGVNWEPGKTEIVYLAVANLGSLALKYDILLDVKDNGLADALEYAVLDGQEATVAATDWATLKADAETGAVVDGYMPILPGGELAAEKTNYFALAVHMREDAGNEFQGKDIVLDVRVVASQLTAETDSFNDQYDADALPCDVLATPETIDAILAEVEAGTVIGLAAGYYDEIVLTQDNLTLISNAAVVGFLNLNAKDGAVIDGLTFDETGAKATYSFKTGNTQVATDYYANVTGDVDSPKAADNVTIRNCTFTNTSGVATVAADKYVPVHFHEQGAATERATNIRIYGCTFAVNAVQYIGLNYLSQGEVVVSDNVFGVAPFGTSHNTINATGNAANWTITGNTFNNWNAENTAIGSSKQGSNVVTWNVSNNQFNHADGAVVMALKTSYTADNTKVIFDNNTTAGGMGTIVASPVNAENETVFGGQKIQLDENVVVVNSSASLKAALKTGTNVVYAPAGTYDDVSLAAGVTLIGEEGTVIKQAGASCAIGSTNNTTVKNVTFEGNTVQRWGYASGTVVFENCTFDADSVYAIHYDGTSGADILYKNCTIIGWAAIGGSPNSLKFEDCKIYGNGRYGCVVTYGGVAEYENCIFDLSDVNATDVYEDGISGRGTATVKVTNCTNVNGDMMDIIYVNKNGKLILDGMTMVSNPIVVPVAPLEEDFLFPAGTNAVMYTDMVMSGDAQITHTEDAVLGLSNVVGTLDHDVIIRKSGGAICISDCEFTLTDGAKLISVGEGGDAYQVFLVNVKVNGELLTDANAGQYLEGISWFGAYPEWPNT